MDKPCFKAADKGELFRRLAQRYPALAVDGLELTATFSAVGKAVDDVMEQDLRDFGLSEGRFYVLSYLFSEELLGRPAPAPSDIADNLGVTRATITGLLDGLEREGYLERFHDSRDRRALSIGLNEKARDFMDNFVPLAVGSAGRTLAGLDPSEQATLLRLLAKLGPGLPTP